MAAREAWSSLPWNERAAVFLKAADLIAGPYRAKINAATMLAQSKNIFQAEIDAACELIDFLRFNAYFLQEIQDVQPDSQDGIWNRMEYRGLEGFVFAITPFNFTAIAANLCAAPALMGNVVVWKPADSQVYSAQVIMEVFKAAGLPDGVINMVTCDGPAAGRVVFDHPDFAGLHFTGSTGVFRHLWTAIGQNISKYQTTHASSVRQAAKILCWRTHRPVWTKWSPDWCVEHLNFKVRSAALPLELTCPRVLAPHQREIDCAS